MTLTIELPNELYKKIEEQASAKGMTPESLIVAYAEEKTQGELGADFDGIADYLLKKNEELYKRLA